MRLLHIAHQYSPAIGGAEQYITQLSEELVRRNHQVTLFTSRSVDYLSWQNTLPANETINGVQVRRFRSIPRLKHTWSLLRYALYHYPRSHRRWLEALLFYGNGPIMPELFWRIILEAPHYDLMHISQLHYAHAYTASLAARLVGLPYVITPHLHLEHWETFDVGYMRRVLHNSETVIAVSPAEQQFIHQQQVSECVALGGNALNLASFPAISSLEARRRLEIAADEFVVLFLGRKTRYKGLEETLHAYLHLRQTYSNVRLLAFGAETEYSTALWAKEGDVPGLLRRDKVSEEEKLDALAACDVLVMPSRGEAFGIVYLEAWAYSKPVIGARIRATSSLIEEGVDGFLVDPTKSDELSARLETLLTDRARAGQMGKAGNQKLHRRYTLEKIGDIVEAIGWRALRRTQTRKG